MLSGDGFFVRPPTRRRVGASKPAGRQAASFRAQGQVGHLSVHVWRPEPHRHVRLQAEDEGHGRQNGRRENLRSRRPQRRAAESSNRDGNFQQHGQCGKWVSSLFPNVAKHVDDIAFLHSMTADSPIHGSAMLMMNSGKILSGSPALGSWVNYGLGAVNENLPGFCRHARSQGGPISGAKNWSSGYMPATYPGHRVPQRRRSDLESGSRPTDLPAGVQRELIDSIQDANRRHLASRAGNDDLASRIASYELAYKMQTTAPEAVDCRPKTTQRFECMGSINHEPETLGRAA